MEVAEHHLGGRSAAPLLGSVAGFAADLAITQALLAVGVTLAAASLAGFVIGFGAALAATTLRRRAPGASAPSRPWSVVAVLRHLALAAIALGLRGGAMATAISFALPIWLAVIAGVAVCWIASAIGDTLYTFPRSEAEQPAESRWTLAAAGILACVLLLRLLTLKVIGVLPQEAYYWNYSIRPDLGYHDHPPMVAWLIALGERLLGHDPAGVRLPSFVCGLVSIFFVHRLALRLVDRPSALVAAALAAVLPYFFFGAGALMTPDAPLIAAWAAALYYLHCALVGDRRAAWLGVGAAIGIGMLSKYTIALLGPAALAFCLLDARARRWLARPQPYLAMLLALALFAPVIYWNYAHDWASFAFQAGGRYGAEAHFSLGRLLLNMLAVATPLPFMALPLLLARRWSDEPEHLSQPEHAQLRNRIFVACFVLVPVAVFAWSALTHLPRLNWTGPIWLATLPMLGWAIVRARVLPQRAVGLAVRLTAPHVIGGLLAAYALGAYYVVIGIPGVGYPAALAPAMGWPEAARQLHTVQRRIERETGAVPVVVGMDAYQIASMLSYYGTADYLAKGDSATRGAAGSDQRALNPTAIGRLFGGDGLMFAYWYPPAQFAGHDLLMVAKSRDALADDRLAEHFGRLGSEIRPLSLASTGYGGISETIGTYYYRVGYGYLPAAPTR